VYNCLVSKENEGSKIGESHIRGRRFIGNCLPFKEIRLVMLRVLVPIAVTFHQSKV
jgi:hypothetical protein